MTATGYVFPGVVVRVIDGDTIVARITISAVSAFHEDFTVKAERVWRLNGCNAREAHDPTGGGAAATDNLRRILEPGMEVTISSIKVDPYTSDRYESARYEATVTLADGTDLVTELIDTGYAAKWNGVSQPRPIPPWPIP